MDVEVPDTIVFVDYSKVLADPDTGVRMVKNEALVKIDAGTDDSTIRDVINSIQGSIIGGIKEIEVYHIRIQDTEDLPLLKEVICDTIF